MPVSQKITVTKNAEGATVVTNADATILDAFTSLLSPDQAVTGWIGVGQKVAIFVGGMAAQEYRRSGRLNPL